MQLHKVELLHAESFHRTKDALLNKFRSGLVGEDVGHEFGEDMDLRERAIMEGWRGLPGSKEFTEDRFTGAIDISGIEGGEARAGVKGQGAEDDGFRDEAMATGEGPAAIKEGGEGSRGGIVEANRRQRRRN